MTDTPRRTSRLVILGGGTAGWITAAAFSKLLGANLGITLIESEQIGTVGLGEATIPQIIRLNGMLGIDENDFLSHTQGSFKLGIEFVDWGKRGDRYLHTFGDIGLNLANVPFHQYWLRHRQAGGERSLWQHSLHQHAADLGKFAKVPRVGRTSMTGLAYAYHFDAGKYAAFLRRYSEAKGVTRKEGIVGSVDRDPSSGDITALNLQDGTRVDGDFFVDCTGFRALLLGEELGVPYVDWSEWLPCDRALAVASVPLDPLPPFTRATAQTAGWQWRIPLQHRTGNGHVYCSDYISEDEASAELLAGIDGEVIGDPRPIRFKTGRREALWSHNCVAIGLSGGFLEPLESTSIHLIQSNVSRLIETFPRGKTRSVDRDEYNRGVLHEFEQIRDFLILHYHQTARRDTPFWKRCAEMEIPTSLRRKIDVFRASGRITRDPDDLFKESSWLQVMVGQGIVPESYHPMADTLTNEQLEQFLADVSRLIEGEVDRLPTHGDYLRTHCP